MTSTRTLKQMISILALSSACAHAAPVFEQASSGAFNTAWTSHLGIGQGGYQAFDDFKLGQDAAINKVTWKGTYFTTNAGELQGGAPNTDSWTVEFWSGDASGPAAPVFSRSYAAADAHRTSSGRSGFGSNGFDVYDFELELGTEFDADAGVQYWFSVRSDSNSGFSPFFSWLSADSPGSTVQKFFDGRGTPLLTTVRGGDRAFALYAVPEPGSLALVMGALLLAPAAARRRRAIQ